IRGVSEPLGTLLDGRDPGGVADRWFIDNGLTNLTLFRHYLMHYLAERPDIIKEMYIVARTLKPSPSGIPLEIYCFTTSTLWKDYENTQSAIFEYITAVAGQFSLRLYQYPAGHDFWRLS
ncbi:mechanosensitive ion channel, partial [Klebsiella pneumoniae]